mgnify:FL=1
MASNFKKYALDFIVVFLGISVSFGLNNLNEKRKDRVSEKNYYKNLLEDARQDLSNLENQIMVCEQRLDASNEILILVQNNSSIKEIVSNSFNAIRQMSNKR